MCTKGYSGGKFKGGEKGMKKERDVKRYQRHATDLSSLQLTTATHTHTHALTPSVVQKEASGIKNKEACVQKNSFKFKRFVLTLSI